MSKPLEFQPPLKITSRSSSAATKKRKKIKTESMEAIEEGREALPVDGREEHSLGGGSQKIVKETEKLNTVHMSAFILTAVVGRQYSLWQPALVQGFGQFMIAEIIVAAAFINSFYCLAEIWSAVPFSGGSYGLARAMMGFYPGFLVGCAESFVFITHGAKGALFLGDKICAITGIDPNYTVLFVIPVYAFCYGLCNHTNMVVVRRSFIVLAAVSVTILLIFLFGSLRDTDFHANASLHRSEVYSAPENWFSGGMSSFMLWLPHASLPYAGVKSFTLMSAVTDTPKVTIPRAVSIAVPFIFALNMFVVFVNAAQPGGILHSAVLALPVSAGYIRMFNLVASHTHHALGFLSFPASFGMVYAYMIPSGTLLQSLGRTNLLPSVLRLNHNKDYSQGTLITSILGVVLCVLIHFQPQVDLYNLCLLATAFANISSTYCYIKLKITCPNLERGFLNPLGSAGCIYSALIFVLIFVSAAFMQPNYDALIGAVVLFVILTVYYWGLAVQHQTLCKEEDKVFLMLHVKNFNRNKKRNKRGLHAKKVSADHNSSASGAQSEGSTSAVTDRSIGGWWAQLRGKGFRNNAVSPTGSCANSVGIRSSHGVDPNSRISSTACPGATQSPAPTVSTNTKIDGSVALTASAEACTSAGNVATDDVVTREIEMV